MSAQHLHPHVRITGCRCIACAPEKLPCTCRGCRDLDASWRKSFEEYERKTAGYQYQAPLPSEEAPPSGEGKGNVAMILHLPPRYARALSDLCVQRGNDAEGILLRALTHYQLLLLAAKDGADVTITKNGEPWPIAEPKEHGEYLRWCRRRLRKRVLIVSLCLLQVTAMYAISPALLQAYPVPMAVISLTLALSSLVTLWSIP